MSELPGMWDESDLRGGEADCAEDLLIVRKLKEENAALKEENERLEVEKVQINGKLAGSRLAVSRLKARVAELEKNNLRLGLIAAAVVIENKVAEYDYEHGITEPDTGCRVYPGNGEDYIDSMIELAEELRMIADKEPSHDNQ